MLILIIIFFANFARESVQFTSSRRLRFWTEFDPHVWTKNISALIALYLICYTHQTLPPYNLSCLQKYCINFKKCPGTGRFSSFAGRRVNFKMQTTLRLAPCPRLPEPVGLWPLPGRYCTELINKIMSEAYN